MVKYLNLMIIYVDNNENNSYDASTPGKRGLFSKSWLTSRWAGLLDTIICSILKQGRTYFSNVLRFINEGYDKVM